MCVYVCLCVLCVCVCVCVCVYVYIYICVLLCVAFKFFTEVKFMFKEPEYKVREGTNPLVTVMVVKEGRTVLETSVSYATRNGTAKG